MIGVGDKIRFLQLHLLMYKIGVPKCKVIYKAHILTGSDLISKIGSKKSEINANPESEQPKSTCITFNELRLDMYRS